MEDLALYLGKMSGATIEIVAGAPPAKPKSLPILIGELGEKRFGAPEVKSPFKQAIRVVVSKRAIALIGESDVATSDAVYEVLHRLGCRWYLPGEMGEEIPTSVNISLPEMDISKAPPTIYRNIWYASVAYKRRNRLGGILFNSAHALEGYITKEQREQHPDWNAEFSGKRSPAHGRICWGNPEVAKAVADAIIKKLDEKYISSISLSPHDGMTFCQCEKCKALDTGDWDPGPGQMSITDRYIHFCNQIAERVTAKHPNVILPALAYEQYTRAPTREKPHPNLIFMIAPILYCRAHSMTDPTCRSRTRLKGIVEGWGKVSQRMAIDDYAYNLAEVSCPFPLISKWSGDLPIYYENHMKLFKTETMPTFASSLPGLYLGVRMSWYPESKPEEILDEFFTRFYGSVVEPMRRYWYTMDDAWKNTPEHAGAQFGHGRRFTPEVMKAGRAALDEALATAKTVLEYRRIKLADDSFTQFELYMKMLRTYHAGQWTYLQMQGEQWMGTWKSLEQEYSKESAFSFYGARYFNRLSRLIYKDATRVARDFKILVRPMRKWRLKPDPDQKGKEEGWSKADFDDKDWKEQDPCVQTWSAIDMFGYFGDAWYRAKAKVPAVPAGKKVFLWIGGVDSTCKLFLNGKHISYVNQKGEAAEQFRGYAYPASFDITSAVKANAENQITMLCNRNFGWINEIGTGGLLGPVVIYAEK